VADGDVADILLPSASVPGDVPQRPLREDECGEGPRVPPNLFGIVLGIAGLAQAWDAAVPLLGTARLVPDVLDVLDAALWLVLVGAYLAQGPRVIMADLRDPVLSPFISASALTAMILSAALAREAFTARRVLVIVCLAVTIGIGSWLTGQWMTGGTEPDSVHPGYLLPTAAGGLIGASAASQVHLHALAEASFGIGAISWIRLPHGDPRRPRAAVSRSGYQGRLALVQWVSESRSSIVLTCRGGVANVA
jgi:tellurite resistance protein